MKELGYDINEYDINNIVLEIKDWFNNSLENNGIKCISEDIFCMIVDRNIKGKTLVKK